MKIIRESHFKEAKERWTVCGIQCGACYYNAPIIPHNWLELPPDEWSPPAHKCPSFEYFKFKAYTAVGRGNLAGLVFDDNKFPITDELIKIAYTCTGCSMCSEICYGLQPLSAILALREELVQRGAVLPEPLKKLDANIDKSGNIFGERRTLKAFDGMPTTGDTVYFAGCNARRNPKTFRAMIKILEAAGMDVASLGAAEQCCGFIPGHSGSTQLLEDKAIQNVRALKNAGAKRLVVSCPHCYKVFKTDYPLITGKLPFEVVHITELLAELIASKKVNFTQPLNQKITYHDPCFLGRQSGIYDQPRKILKAIPGIELVEMERHGRWSYCCGAGGGITSSCYPEFAGTIAKERLKEAQGTAANIMVTACPSCFSHMYKAQKKEGIELKICDLSTLALESMGIKA